MVKFGSSRKCLLLLALPLLLCAGCGGIATTQTINPLMFFLPVPGLVDATSTNHSPRMTAPLKSSEPNMELAQAK